MYRNEGEEERNVFCLLYEQHEEKEYWDAVGIDSLAILPQLMFTGRGNWHRVMFVWLTNGTAAVASCSHGEFVDGMSSIHSFVAAAGNSEAGVECMFVRIVRRYSMPMHAFYGCI